MGNEMGGQLQRMGEMRNGKRILVGKHEGEDVDVDGNITIIKIVIRNA
jgi:hypothetical protein